MARTREYVYLTLDMSTVEGKVYQSTITTAYVKSKGDRENKKGETGERVDESR